MGRIISSLVIFGLFFSQNGLAKKFSSCSEKWQSQVRKEASAGIGALAIVSIAFLPAIGGLISESLDARQKSKAANLLQSAGILYTFRHKKYLIEMDHIARVTRFYNKYIADTSLKKLRIGEVIKTLAIYDKVAYDLNKCNNFGRYQSGAVIFSKKSIADNMFKHDKINSKVISDIKKFENRSKKILKNRQKDFDSWVPLD